MQKPKFDKITMNRTASYGTSPVYSLEILSNGQVIFKGIDFVKSKGTHHWELPDTAIIQINNELFSSRFFEIQKQSDYCIIESCQSYITLTVWMNTGETRTIEHDLGSSEWPQSLTDFESLIINVSGIKKYLT